MGVFSNKLPNSTLTSSNPINFTFLPNKFVLGTSTLRKNYTNFFMLLFTSTQISDGKVGKHKKSGIVKFKLNHQLT